MARSQYRGGLRPRRLTSMGMGETRPEQRLLLSKYRGGPPVAPQGARPASEVGFQIADGLRVAQCVRFSPAPLAIPSFLHSRASRTTSPTWYERMSFRSASVKNRRIEKMKIFTIMQGNPLQVLHFGIKEYFDHMGPFFVSGRVF